MPTLTVAQRYNFFHVFSKNVKINNFCVKAVGIFVLKYGIKSHAVCICR